MSPQPCFQPPPVQSRYSLRGPQVQPDASYWHTPMCRPLCIVRPEDLDCHVRLYPQNPTVIQAELDELHELKQLRDDPQAIAGNLGDPIRRRLQISPLLQLRPPPIGAVFNRRRPDPQPIERLNRERWPIERPDPFTPAETPPTEVPVISTGRELARYFEDETPGLAHRHALNAILAEPGFRDRYSPPFQALIWCALDITIYSALLAAWYFKWRGPDGVRYRPRPIEVDPTISVLFNRRPNDTQSGDDGLRTMPPYSPGTPRHPAYPSGHSTHTAAASELLAAFFPDLRAELDQLADNAGMARLWAGIHWRSDHLWGIELGRCVAQHVIWQLQGSCICPPDPCAPPPPCEDPPTYEELQEQAEAQRGCCVTEDGDYRAAAARPAEERPRGQLPQLDRDNQPEVQKDEVRKDES
jgi:PAP2 superfamily protein